MVYTPGIRARPVKSGLFYKGHIMDYKTFCALAKSGSIVPVYKRLSADFITPVMAYLKLRDNKTFSFLLESVIRGEQVGRYSFIGRNPYRILKANDGRTTITDKHRKHTIERSFFDVLKEQLNGYQTQTIEQLPRLTSGAVGFIGYEMIGQVESLPLPKKDTVGCDDAVMAFYDTLVAFDHLKNEVILIANAFIDESSDPAQIFKDAQNRIDLMLNKLNQPLPDGFPFDAQLSREESNFDRSGFTDAVEKAREYIFAGDIFQVVLSQKFRLPYQGDPFRVY